MSNYSFKWIVQRITGVLLIPLTFWFVFNCILFSKFDYNQLISFFDSYVNVILFLIMMIMMLIHAKLGCETITEDYISSEPLKKITIIIINIAVYSSIAVTLISLISLLSRT